MLSKPEFTINKFHTLSTLANASEVGINFKIKYYLILEEISLKRIKLSPLVL